MFCRNVSLSFLFYLMLIISLSLWATWVCAAEANFQKPAISPKPLRFQSISASGYVSKSLFSQSNSSSHALEIYVLQRLFELKSPTFWSYSHISLSLSSYLISVSDNSFFLRNAMEFGSELIVLSLLVLCNSVLFILGY